jgi:DnaJ domain
MTRQQALSILGLSKEPTPEELKSAFRTKVKETHPDRGGDPALFHKVTEARDLLEKAPTPTVRVVRFPADFGMEDLFRQAFSEARFQRAQESAYRREYNFRVHVPKPRSNVVLSDTPEELARKRAEHVDILVDLGILSEEERVKINSKKKP